MATRTLRLSQKFVYLTRVRQFCASSSNGSEANPQQHDDGNANNSGFDEVAILSEALRHVPEYGWSRECIQLGMVSQGLPASSHSYFSRGPDNLIEYFETDANKKLLEFIKELQQGETPIKGPPLIHKAVKYRLEMLIPYIKTWPEAMTVKAYPDNLPRALERLALMLDDIWYEAGDRSTDINWYTKRGMLAGVYCSTEIFMVQDDSVNFEDTWSFLQRRFEDTKTITSARNQLTDVMNGAMELSSAGVTTFRNILGMNSWNR